MQIPQAASEIRYPLLREPLINIVHNGSTMPKTLPEVYADLAVDAVDDFPGMRPHQKHFWHATLCQIGAIAMINQNIVDPPQSSPQWLELLRALTEDEFPNDEPWNLINLDMTGPAFMQPGVSEPGKAADYNKSIATPDQMDLPVGSKHHDVREYNMRQATPEQWLFALVSRQTGGSYDGPNLYEASRMNSGSGNRHGFSLTPSIRWGPHVCRDLTILARKYQGQPVKDLLLWTRPWDGKQQESIPWHTLTPPALYVEVSRRIRLSADKNGGIAAQYATSKTQRVHAKALKGLTGDPWSITESDKSVTINRLGFDYRQIVKYLDPEKYSLPELAEYIPEVDRNANMHLIARALVGGQGKTEGYYERIIPLKSNTAGMLKGRTEQKKLHDAAEKRLKIAGEVAGTLAHAAKTYLQGGTNQGKPGREQQSVIDRTRQQFHHAVDQRFWGDLQQELASEDPDRTRSQWCHQQLIPQARNILEELCHSQLCPRQKRYRSITTARGIFEGGVRKNPKLPELQPQEEEKTK